MGYANAKENPDGSKGPRRRDWTCQNRTCLAAFGHYTDHLHIKHERASRSGVMEREGSRLGRRVSSCACCRLVWCGVLTGSWRRSLYDGGGLGGAGGGCASSSVGRGFPAAGGMVPGRDAGRSGAGWRRRKPGKQAVGLTAPIPAVRGQAVSCPWFSW